MSQTTKLYISKRFELRDIKEVMENYLDLKVQIRKKKVAGGKYITEKFKIEVVPTQDIGFVNFNFIYNNKQRRMAVFSDTDLCIKNLYELHLGYNDDSIEIMTKIAKVFGGLLEENDCGDKGITEIQGMFSENNGLPYFLKYAIIHNQLSNIDDLKSFNEAIYKWHDEIKDSKNTMNLFPRE